MYFIDISSFAYTYRRLNQYVQLILFEASIYSCAHWNRKKAEKEREFIIKTKTSF